MLFTCNVAFPKPLRIVCLSLIHKNDDQSGTPSASKYEASTVDNKDAVNIGIEHVQLVDQRTQGPLFNTLGVWRSNPTVIRATVRPTAGDWLSLGGTGQGCDDENKLNQRF